MSANDLKFYTINFDYFMKSTPNISSGGLKQNNEDIENNIPKQCQALTPINVLNKEQNQKAQVMPKPSNKSSNSGHFNMQNGNNYQAKNGSIDTDKSKENIDEQMILKGLEYFLKQHFLSTADLNRADLQKVISPYGDDSWNIQELVKHRSTGQYMDMLNDKYKLTNESGTSTKIPFSFYFDLSGSMFKYTGLLIKMIDRLLSNKVAVIYGYNQYIHQILNENTNYKSIEELTKHIESPSTTTTNQILDKYLIEHEAEKAVVFSDYDSFNEIINLSKKALVYWFCFEERSYDRKRNIDLFNGLLYHTTSFEDFRRHINKIDDRGYEVRQRLLQKTIDSGVKRNDI